MPDSDKKNANGASPKINNIDYKTKTKTSRLLGLFLAALVTVTGGCALFSDADDEEEYYEEECSDENCADQARGYYGGTSHYHVYSSYYGRVPYNSIPKNTAVTSVPKGTVASFAAKGGLGSYAGKGGTG